MIFEKLVMMEMYGNMKNKKLIQAAEGAKRDGYDFLSTIVKYENGRPLYHVVSIDVILKFKEWPPAKIEIMEPLKVVAEGKEVEIPQHGVKVFRKLPEKTISKTEALRRYR